MCAGGYSYYMNPELETTPAERTNGLLCHILAFCGYLVPFGNLIGPLVIWKMKGKECSFVDGHGKESINFQISMSIYVLIGLVLLFVGIGILILMALAIFNLVVVIIAAIKANDGGFYAYPLNIRFIK